ncbi:MAG: CocE/NonD family hydrolase [Holophaga sp.]|nr:CocE/NonD family hydrolase [Holophaga sp.]
MKPSALLALALALPLSGQGASFLRAHYRKQEVRIPMRDGVRLFTAIYTPDRPGPFPVLLHRTCYGVGPYGPQAFPDELGPDPELARDGYIFVYQDVRGKMMSEGSFQEMTPLLDGRGVDEATDAWDTIDWVLKQVPGNNGRVGAWGISYPGFYAACALVGAHPALKAVSPQAPIADLFAGDDDHHNGALFLAQTFWFDATFAVPRPRPASQPPAPPGFMRFHPDGYQFFLELGALPHVNARYFHGQVAVWNEELAHGVYDGYWRARDLRPHLKAIRPATLTVGGWFDPEDLFGTLQVHQRLGADDILVMGPWDHGGWSEGDGDQLGGARFGSGTASFYRTRIEAPFFRHHLKGAADPGLAKAIVYDTGTSQWRQFRAWPPPGLRPTPLYLQAGGGLGFQTPADGAGADAFVSDPAHPVPYTAGTEAEVSPAFMVEDQRFAARRPDVLVYQTPVLTAPVTLAGPLQARLQVSTSGTDADWVVKLIDVLPGESGEPEPAAPAFAPGGCQQLVRAEVMRGKFRRSLAAPEPFVPGQPTAVAFALNDVCHTFRKGHRIMVQIQSSWFPLVDRNPQVFTDIYHAKDGDFRKAQHRVYRNAALPSCLVLPVLD